MIHDTRVVNATYKMVGLIDSERSDNILRDWNSGFFLHHQPRIGFQNELSSGGLTFFAMHYGSVRSYNKCVGRIPYSVRTDLRSVNRVHAVIGAVSSNAETRAGITLLRCSRIP